MSAAGALRHLAPRTPLCLGRPPKGEAQPTPPHKSGLFPIPEDAQKFGSNVVLCIVKWPCFVLGLGLALFFFLRPILCEPRPPATRRRDGATHFFICSTALEPAKQHAFLYKQYTRHGRPHATSPHCLGHILAPCTCTLSPQPIRILFYLDGCRRLLGFQPRRPQVVSFMSLVCCTLSTVY